MLMYNKGAPLKSPYLYSVSLNGNCFICTFENLTFTPSCGGFICEQGVLI